ncbi:15-hydroxyprostaglandin dehydrogenase [NAD(+)]-like [Aethina tumida]|uniref:15-hydroxyprostaglandin dehydrogenase [NAD(+)]-like n=1 Tax=Aethina tumida TaxID=116153 RepID=UPI00096B19C1|nr:15-hydroxyprostaglandin dehydrogenase [NAD(+)]-like [Aethina tumida]XP_049819392.1 15-hydroxyprostaglandin dehydrogenase [NAD(+)]-like [Aethina tumida]XP_049819393.1 15-hydroxyprostaglandin dehydrogenase [NAD(+)]-like [Aethina tumida]XP_049819394.1 15-hydroxyprostaglandin dehydrogenase [NAD(+)]-like [Aethina tumida]
MTFEISGKVAIITGASGGIGAAVTKQLLKNNVKGVTLIDVNIEKGNELIEEIENEFGPNKAIFMKVDVADLQEFESAFKATLDKFGNVDILFNNAGILNDKQWQKMVPVNFNGVVNGMLLGLDNYIKNHKTGSEGVIVNTSSIAGVGCFGNIPIYSGTKWAVHGMTRAWGVPFHYERTKVKVFAICPGATDTPLMYSMKDNTLGGPYQKLNEINKDAHIQSSEQCAEGIMKLIQKATSGSVWVIKDGKDPYEFLDPEMINPPC